MFWGFSPFMHVISGGSLGGAFMIRTLIGAEIGELRQKIKKIGFCQNSIFWECMGAIWIDSVSFEVVPPHFRSSGPSANDRYGHLESNALIKIEFGEFCQKLKNWEVQQNSKFW